MNRWLRLATVMLAVEVEDIGVWVMSTPQHRGAIPTHVHCEALRKIVRDVERFAQDQFFRHRIDRTGAQARDSLRSRLALERLDARQFLTLLFLRQMRNMVPAGVDGEFAAHAIASISLVERSS